MIPELETERLLLRAPKNEDMDALYDILSDPQAMRFLGTGRTMSRQEAWLQIATLLGHWQLRGYGQWMLELKETGEVLGRAGFYNPEGWPGFEIGWTLRRKHWGQGYATEAARTAMAYGFETLKAEKIISVIQPGNKASINVAEKLGETLEGEQDLNDIRVLIYGLDRDAWCRHTAAT